MTHDGVWVQVTSGRGPVECQLAVGHFVRVLSEDARARAVSVDVLDCVEGGERGALLSALVALNGVGAGALAQRYAGTVQWICPSPVRPRHRRKNWFIGVGVFAQPDPQRLHFDVRDVTFEAMRAGGAGGQHVNKTESAVRASHRPTGLVVTAREERSQHQNRRLALARLQALIVDGETARQATVEALRWAEHDGLARGDPVATFVGPTFRLRG